MLVAAFKNRITLFFLMKRVKSFSGNGSVTRHTSTITRTLALYVYNYTIILYFFITLCSLPLSLKNTQTRI